MQKQKSITGLVVRFAAAQRGATKAEYGVISIGIAVAVIVAVNPMGSQFKTMIGTIASLIGAAFR